MQQTKDQKMCRESTRQARKTQLKRDPTAKKKVREQKQAEQMTPLEGKENELQQTKDQKGSLEVNRQARKTQPERDHKAKEEVREGKRPGMAKQLRDLETELKEKVREDLSQSYFTRPPPAQRARDRARDSKTGT